jgi:glc operon protein GlcG
VRSLILSLAILAAMAGLALGARAAVAPVLAAVASDRALPSLPSGKVLAEADAVPLGQDGATFAQASISIAAANRMLDAAEQRARDLGAVQSFAVVDQAGRLKAFRRMDGARGSTIQTAQDKAYTAVAYGEDTRALWERGGQNAAYVASITHQEHVYLTPGGRVLSVDGQVVGAVGVAGGRAGEDEPVADAALAALAR